MEEQNRRGKNIKWFLGGVVACGAVMALLYFLALLLPLGSAPSEPDSLQALPSAFRGGANSFFKALQQLDSADIIIMFAYLYVIISVSMNMELSRQDLHMAAKGLLVLEVLFLLLSVLAFLAGWQLDTFIDFLFQWNLLISFVGIICGLTFHLISLLSA